MSDHRRAWRDRERTNERVKRSAQQVEHAVRDYRRMDIEPSSGGEKRRDRERQCTRKKAFPSEAIAQAKADLLLDHIGKEEFSVVPYLCPWCAKWHIGSRRLQ